MRSKYGNKWTEIDGHKFQSKAEAARYVYLLEQLRTGKITCLKLQPKFDFVVNGTPLKSYKRRQLSYKGDFLYHVPLGRGKTEVICEDVKGFETDVWNIKWALVKACFPATKFRAVYKRGEDWEVRGE